MAVQNRIVKVQKRNRALVKFDDTRIRQAIVRAAESIGGFGQDLVPGINDTIFEAQGTDARIAEFLADAVVVCLNSDPHHLIDNFPPTIETIQDEVLHALRSYGFQNTADAYACYRWGRHWLREGAIQPEKFAGNGFPKLTVTGYGKYRGTFQRNRPFSKLKMLPQTPSRQIGMIGASTSFMIRSNPRRNGRSWPIRVIWPSAKMTTTSPLRIASLAMRSA